MTIYNHEAVLNIHSNVRKVSDKSGSTKAYDANGDEVTIDGTAVAAEETSVIAAIKLSQLRFERNRKLAETDYLALSDNTMSAAMTTYRQSLRDITDNYSSLDTVVWPTKP